MNQMITIPKAEYQSLLEAAESLSDIIAFDRAAAALSSGDEELIPAAFADRLIAGENPLAVYRDLRRLTQIALAEKSGVHRVSIAEIETGRKQGSLGTLKKLADALGVAVDDLI
jgi:DNA-binding XRE family transcriptional regulator